MTKGLKRNDYNWVEEEAENLVEDLGLKIFPLDCFQVAEQLDIGIHACSEFSTKDEEFIVSRYPDGFTVFKKGKYHIYYNESQDSNRIKFTVWHEIAYIQLGHLEADCTKSKEQKEEEANHFAAHLMAPLAFIHNLGLEDPQEIADLFEISINLACNAYRHYINAFRYTCIKNIILNSRLAKLLVYLSKDDVA